MEPSTPPLKRRRRRWLIVSVVLVLVSTVAWWYWPRGDARFVGRWQCTLNEPVWPRQPEKKWEWRFDSDGRRHVIGDGGRETESRWQIAGGLLFLDDPRQPFESMVRLKSERFLLSLTGKHYGHTASGFKIIVEGPDKFVLRQPPHSRDFHLRRIPE